MSARLRIDFCCNDPDNGVFTHEVEAFQVETWDGEPVEFEVRRRPIRFVEKPSAIRICRRDWPVLGSKEWFGNWCWNAYWLTPDVLLGLLDAMKRSGHFGCGCGPTQLFDNWNDPAAPLSRDLWMANLWGRPSIGEAIP